MIVNIPSSQGGLNLKDSLDAMDIRYAIQMDNIIPDTNRDTLRSGCKQISTMPATRLMTYNKKGMETLLCAADGAIYKMNADNSRSVLKSGFAGDKWQYCSFTDGSGNVNTILTNGTTDNVQRVYDNSGTLTITNAYNSATSLICPCSYKNRMYFAVADSTVIKYTETQAINGNLKTADLGTVFKLGGSIVSLANWTQNAGTGMSNLLCVLSSEGEVAVYNGSSPESTDWTLSGVFRISKPIGIDCTCQLGGDIVVITQDGYFPLSEVLSQDRANRVELSDKINPIVEGKNFYQTWGVYWYPKKGWLLINAPSTDTGYSHEQHVFNINTGSWCRFVGWDAFNFATVNDNLYFCNGTGIFQADKGTTDNGKKITYYLQKAYTQLDMPEIKQVLLVKERNKTLGQEIIGSRIGVDFKLEDPSSRLVQLEGTNTYWDKAIWDESFWSTERPITQLKTPIFSSFGNFISVGVLGQSANSLEFYGLQAKIKVGTGETW